MNKFLSLFATLFISLMCFSSCSDNDTDEPFPSEKGPGSTADLIGYWESVSQVSWTKVDGIITSGSEEPTINEHNLYMFGENGVMKKWDRGDGRTDWNVVKRFGDEYNFQYTHGILTIYARNDDGTNGNLSQTSKVLILDESTLVIETSNTRDNTQYYNKITFNKIPNPFTTK